MNNERKLNMSENVNVKELNHQQEEQTSEFESYKLTNQEVDEVAAVLKENVEQNKNLSMIANLPSNNGVEEHKATDEETGESKLVQVKINPETGERTVIGEAVEKEKKSMDDILGEIGDTVDHIDFEDIGKNYTISPEDMRGAIAEDEIIEDDINLSDETILQLIDIVNRHRNGETIRYRDMPQEIVTSYLDPYLKQHGIEPINCSKQANELRNDIAEMMISQYEISISSDKVLEEYNEEIEKAFQGIEKDMSSYLKEYNENKEKCLDKICEKITDEEKREKVKEIMESINDGYHLERMKGFHVRIKPIELEKPNRVIDIIAQKYMNNKQHMYNLYQLTQILTRHLVQNGYDPFGLRFILTFCKFCMNFDPDNPVQHAFMYYVAYNIALLDVYRGKEYDEFAPAFLANIAEVMGEEKDERVSNSTK